MTNWTPSLLVTGNRSVGLLREIQDAITSEDNSLELRRLAQSLKMLADNAAGRIAEIEAQSKTIARAARAQTVTRRRRNDAVRRMLGAA